MSHSPHRTHEAGAESPPSLFHVGKTFSALKHPAYRLLWLSSVAGFAGMQMQMVARGYLAYDIGGAASSIALITLAWGIPMMILSLPGGAIADRFDRRTLVVASQGGTAVIGLAIAFMVQTGIISLELLFVTGLLQGAIFALTFPARQALIPDVVEESQLMNAIALNQAGLNLTRIAGPGLAGALIAIPFIDIQGVFYIQGALNIVALLLLLAMPAASLVRRSRRAGDDEKASLADDVTLGLRYVASSPLLRTLLIMGMVPMLLGLSFQSFLPVFAKNVFGDGVHGNSTGLGLMMTMIGVGAIVGSLAVAATADYPRRTLLQIAAGLLFGASLILFGAQQHFVFALLALVVLGFVSDYFAALNGTIIVSASDPAYYGRVMSINIMTFALMPVGTLPIGLLADAIGHVSLGGVEFIGVQVTTIGCGVIITAFMGAVALFNRSYRNLEQTDLKRSAVVATDRLASSRSASAEDAAPVVLS